MFGGESSFEPLVSLSFLRMGAQIVSERQPPPHLSIWLRDMHVMGALCAKGRHPLDEEHSILLRIVGPIDVIKISERLNESGLRGSQ